MGKELTIFIFHGLLSLSTSTLELLFPFDDKTYVYEVYRNDPIQDSSGACGMTFSNVKPSGFTTQSVILDGSSYFDIRIEDVTVTDYSFSGWFRTTLENGVLFHYKADDSLAQLQELKMWLVSKQCNFARVLQSKTETDVHGSTFSLDTWYYVSFGIKKSSGTMWVYMDESKVYDKDEGYTNNVELSAPGTLRIGGTFDNSVPPMTGFATCLGFHNDEFPHYSVTKPICTSSTWGQYQPVCSSSSSRNRGLYNFYSGSTANLEVITMTTLPSPMSCSSVCLQETDCTHFQFDRLSTGYSDCFLLKTGTGNVNPINGQIYILSYFT